MENRGRGRLRGVAVLAALAAVAVTAAVWTGSSAASSKADANPFAHYGNITLNVWSADNQDPGPEPVIKALAASFSKKYPNVKIKLKFYSFTQLHQDHQARAQQQQRRRTWPRATRAYGIDSAAGQGEADQAARQLRQEVRLGQAVHGRARRSSSAGRPTARPSARATSGASPSSGSRPASSTTRRCSRSTAATPTTCRRRSPTSTSCWPSCARTRLRSVPIIELGNKDGYEALHAFGMVQGAYVSGQFMRNWIFHAPGSDVRVARQHQGADHVPEVVQGRLLRQRLQRASTRTPPQPRSPRARACSTSAATGRPTVIQTRPQGQRRVHEHASRPERQVRRDRRHEPARGTSPPRRSIPMSARPSSTG